METKKTEIKTVCRCGNELTLREGNYSENCKKCGVKYTVMAEGMKYSVEWEVKNG